MEYRENKKLPKDIFNAFAKAKKYNLFEESDPYPTKIREKVKFINGCTLTLSTNFDPDKKKRSRVILSLKNERGKGAARADIMHFDDVKGPWSIDYNGITYTVYLESAE